MTLSPTANGPAAQPGSSIQEVWSPPLSLLEVAGCDDGLIADLIDAFSTDTGARIEQMRAALVNSDFTRILAEAHTIKGGARQVGADAVADACQELEAISKLREAWLVAAPLNRVQELFEMTRRTMAFYSSNYRCKP